MTQENKNNTALTDIISAAIRLPGVKVNRELFLREQFKNKPAELLDSIIEVGPIEAGITRDELIKFAKARINYLTVLSSGASFAAGIPGGIGLAVTIPADVAQFYGIALRLSQELCYLYGIADLWENAVPDQDAVMHQLVLYCGVMLGASGAAQAVRVMSKQLAEGVAKQLARSPITKSLLFRIAKTILKWFNITLLKNTAIKGIGKAIPVIGGFVSGAITFASMKPMGMRLVTTLDKACFDYSESELQQDLEEIEEICEQSESDSVEEASTSSDILAKIEQAQKMLDAGILTAEEFASIKAKLIAEM